MITKSRGKITITNDEQLFIAGGSEPVAWDYIARGLHPSHCYVWIKIGRAWAMVWSVELIIDDQTATITPAMMPKVTWRRLCRELKG